MLIFGLLSAVNLCLTVSAIKFLLLVKIKKSMKYGKIQKKILLFFMFLLFVVPRFEISGNTITGAETPATLAARQKTAPELNVWSSLGAETNGQPSRKNEQSEQKGDLNVWSSLDAELDDQLDQKKQQLKEENKRLDKVLKLLNTQKSIERKQAQIREKSSIVNELNFWAGAAKKMISQTDKLKKKLVNIDKMLQKLQATD